MDSIIINVDNPIKGKFDVLILFLVAYTCIMAMYNTAFKNDDEANGSSLFLLLIEIFFVMDFFLNFFTAYRHPDKQIEVRDLTEIALNYLKSWMFPDLIAVFPFQLLVDNGMTLKLFRLVRFPRVIKLLDNNKFNNLTHTFWSSDSIIDIAKRDNATQYYMIIR